MPTIAELHADMRRAYNWGATGIVTSGVVWVAAGLVAWYGAPQRAVWTLFIGAAFIFPVANLLDRAFGAPGTHAPTNSLGKLAMEGTIFMLMCLPGTYALSLYRIEWFFPAVLMVIGGRYLTFGTLYGTRIDWALGALLGELPCSRSTGRCRPTALRCSAAASRSCSVWHCSPGYAEECDVRGFADVHRRDAVKALLATVARHWPHDWEGPTAWPGYGTSATARPTASWQ